MLFFTRPKPTWPTTNMQLLISTLKPTFRAHPTKAKFLPFVFLFFSLLFFATLFSSSLLLVFLMIHAWVGSLELASWLDNIGPCSIQLPCGCHVHMKGDDLITFFHLFLPPILISQWATVKAMQSQVISRISGSGQFN